VTTTQVTLIQIDNYGPWTVTPEPRREVDLQTLQSRLYADISQLVGNRQGYTFFRRNLLEQATLPILPAGFWDRPGPSEQIFFNKARITPILDDGPHPTFDVSAANRRGDSLRFRAVPYGHTRYYIDRPLLDGRLASHWSYNEYMVRLERLDGQIRGKPITTETMGQGFGSLEYAWGLGF
jgi:hypothetical protein